MARTRTWVVNSGSEARFVGGKLLQPGEGVHVVDGDADPQEVGVPFTDADRRDLDRLAGGDVAGAVPVKITGGNRVGDLLTAVRSPGWVFTTGQWYLDGTAVGSATAGLTLTQLSTAIGKAYGFQPTGVPYRATAEPTVAEAPVAPGAPTIGAATAGDGLVNVVFTAGSTGGSPILEFQGELSNGASANGASSPIVVPSANGVPVTARARGRNAVGWGAWSTSSNSVTPGGEVPAAVYGSSDTLRVTSSSRVRLGAGRIVSLQNDGANTVDVTLYDDHTATGRVVYTGTIAVGATTTLNERVVLGAYLALVGTSPAVIVTSDEA